MTCKYCRSRVDGWRVECKNCGAPVHTYPMNNAWGGFLIDQDLSAYGSSWQPSSMPGCQDLRPHDALHEALTILKGKT